MMALKKLMSPARFYAAFIQYNFISEKDNEIVQIHLVNLFVYPKKYRH